MLPQSSDLNEALAAGEIDSSIAPPYARASLPGRGPRPCSPARPGILVSESRRQAGARTRLRRGQYLRERRYGHDGAHGDSRGDVRPPGPSRAPPRGGADGRGRGAWRTVALGGLLLGWLVVRRVGHAGLDGAAADRDRGAARPAA